MKKIDKNIDIVVGVSIGVIVLMASGILCIISMLVSDCIIMQFFFFYLIIFTVSSSAQVAKTIHNNLQAKFHGIFDLNFHTYIFYAYHFNLFFV